MSISRYYGCKNWSQLLRFGEAWNTRLESKNTQCRPCQTERKYPLFCPKCGRIHAKFQKKITRKIRKNGVLAVEFLITASQTHLNQRQMRKFRPIFRTLWGIYRTNTGQKMWFTRAYTEMKPHRICMRTSCHWMNAASSIATNFMVQKTPFLTYKLIFLSKSATNMVWIAALKAAKPSTQKFVIGVDSENGI